MAEANQIIFIEAFLASKKIKLTLFLQALFKALKTTITFWCFVFVTLFNLQGTRCVPQRFLMISLRFPFVKNFFQKVFPGRPAGRGAPRLPGFGPSRRRVRYYTRPRRPGCGKLARTQDADNSSAAERGQSPRRPSLVDSLYISIERYV